MINYYSLPLDDIASYQTLCDGKTKGVFQLESNLGHHFTKQLKPETIEHLSALGAILRPGVLENQIVVNDKKKSTTQSYCDRKNGTEPVVIDIPHCDDILEPTYGHMVYQEQLIAIASRLAGLSLEEADKFRKAVGKKIVSLMNEAEVMFIEGCKKVGLVSEEEAHNIFEMMRKSQRYLFNKSHSLSYSLISYYTAYAKTHYPTEFFCAYLEYAKEKMDPQKEIKDLIQEMKLYDISLKIPSILEILKTKETSFSILNDNIILFGLSSVKGIGEAQIKNLISELERIVNILQIYPDKISWFDILCNLKINKTALHNLISVGVFDNFKIPRKRMLYEHDLIHQLSDREKKIIQNSTCLKSGLEKLIYNKKSEGGAATLQRREFVSGLLKSLCNPPYKLEDDIRWIFEQEVQLLGCNISCSKLDYRDTSIGDTKCIDFINKKSGKMILCVEILLVKEYIINKGKNEGQKMAFLTVEDETGKIDCCIFNEKYNEYQSLLYVGNTIVISGYRSKKDSLVIEAVRDL